MKTTITRREFVGAAGAGVALVTSSRAALISPAAADRAFEHGRPLHEFGYGDVQFAPGVHQTQLEQTHEILMGLDEDALMRPFRMAAGLPAPGRDLGGWHSSPVTFGPESVGHWMSALSRYYAITADAPTRAKVERWLALFSETVDPAGSIFKQYKSRPACMYNKLLCGLEDAYHYAGLKPALDVMERWTTAALPYLPGRAVDQFAQQSADETYIVPEYQFAAWQWGADARHLQIARDYLHHSFFDALAAGKNVLPGCHAYSHANSLSSAAKAYLVLGEGRYLQAAINGFKFMEAQSHATGAWGVGEQFVPVKWSAKDIAATQKVRPDWDPTAYDSLGDGILKTDIHFETPCGSHAHFKLTRYLLRITKDPHYGDSMERVMYNCALGVLPLKRLGKAFYQSNYSRYATKQYFDGYGAAIEDEWPCCSGTLPQLAADYRVSAYFCDEAGVYVNLYIPSTLRWKQGAADIALTQAGDYPLADNVSFEVAASRPSRFALSLRIPAWAKSPMIKINGRPLSQEIKPGAFAKIARKWASGDRIELILPKELELRSVDATHPDLVALVNGPIVLFAIGHDLPKLTRQALLAARQAAPGSPEWKSGDVRFLPWWIIKREVYTTYHDVGRAV